MKHKLYIASGSSTTSVKNSGYSPVPLYAAESLYLSHCKLVLVDTVFCAL